MGGCVSKRPPRYGGTAKAPGTKMIPARYFAKFPIVAPKAAVISEEMLASQAGLGVLRRGGNAADAVLATTACMQVLQPYTIGVGGDCFALFYDARAKKVSCIDGSGRSPAAITLEYATSQYRLHLRRKKWADGFYATVPGAVKAWFHIASRYGSGNLDMSELFSQAAHYADRGFPMDHLKKMAWQMKCKALMRMPGGRYFLDKDCNIPALGDTCINQPLSALLRGLAAEGPAFFYKGCVAESMVRAVQQAGGVLSTQDLADHLASTEPLDVDPVCTTYRGRFNVHTTPLPTQGAVLLEALNILDGFNLSDHGDVPGEFEHVVIEALRHAVADGLRYVADSSTGGSLETMLSKDRSRWIRTQIDMTSRAKSVCPDVPSVSRIANTTFVAAVDESGNVCALLGSNSNFFGVAVVEEYGFAVQSRGNGFTWIPGHPNVFGPCKKPYHTLMPVLVTDADTHDWLCTLGTMGGLSQPAITLQVLVNLFELGMDPQQSVAKTRFLLGNFLSAHPDRPLGLEAGFSSETLQKLQLLGHTIGDVFPEGDWLNAGHALVLSSGPNLRIGPDQELRPDETGRSLWCGIDPRCNGSALGY